MKVLNDNSLNAQKSNNPFIIEKIFLFKLIENTDVTLVLSTTTLKLSGNQVSLISVNDYVIFPLLNFTVSFLVLDVSYDNGDDLTVIQVDDGNFDSTYIGTNISVGIDITEKLLKNSIKDIVQKIEGVELNSFDSGKLDFDVDNSDGYFSNKNKTGIFDSGGVFYVKYIIKFKASQDFEYIYFGGILSLTDSYPDYYNKSYAIRVLGHSKELERYAAYKVSSNNESTFTKISGVIVLNYEASADSQEGVKNVKYEPFSNSKMKGITVESVSPDTTEGIKILEFRWPYFFRWDNGDWYQIGSVADTSSGKKKMYAKDGSVNSKYAIVVFGDSDSLNEYPDGDTEDWVDVKNSDTQKQGTEITQQGAPKFTFDNGEPILMKVHFQRVLIYEDSGVTYTDVSDTVNIPIDNGGDSVDIFVAANDEIIIVSPDRFWGVEFFLNDLFISGDTYVKYSQGGLTWSDAIDLLNNGFVDETEGFSKSGKIVWTDLPNWSENDIVVSTTVNYKGFMIKIGVTSSIGTGSVFEIRRISKVQGETGDFLTIKFNQSGLTKELVTDNIVILKNIDEEWIWSFWYNNVPVTYLLDRCLDESYYVDSKRSLTSLKIVKTSPRFNIWGKSPKYSYAKVMRTIYIEYIDEDNFTVWSLIDNEIWKCTNKGIWEFVYEIIMPQTTGGSEYLYEWIAQQITKVGDSLFCYFSYYHYDSYIHGGNIHFVEYDVVTGDLTVIATGAFGSATKDCFLYNRDGYGFSSGGYYKRRLGNYLGTIYGENVCIPFRQWLNARGSMIPAQYPMENLWDDFDNAFPEWYYDQYDSPISDNAGLYYKGKMGFYGLFNAYDQNLFQVEMEFKFGFGQKGMLLMLKSTGDVYLFVRNGSSPNYYWILTKLNDDTPTRHVCYDANQLPSAHWYDEDNDELYLCYTAWRDSGTSVDIYSNSYITKTLLAETPVRIWARAYHYDATSFVTTEVTTEANAGTLFGSGYVFSADDDAFYLGSDYRFNKVYVALLTPTSSNFVIEYWDGSAWTAVQNNYDSEFTDPFMAVFNCPSDWALTVVSGSQTLYFIRIRQVSGGGTAVVGFELTEIVLWHSYDDGYETWSPINIVGDKTPEDGWLYGVAFNRTPEGDNPFQWRLFVLGKEGFSSQFFTDVNAIGFTIDNTQLYKDLVFNPIDNSAYLIAENIRFKDRSAYLLKVELNQITDQLDVTYCGIPVSGEWGNIGNNQLVCEENSGSIFGITNGNKYKFWEYSKEYYQRIEVANLSGFNSIRDVIRELALITNCIYWISPERIIQFIKRDEYNGTMDLTWDENVLTEKPEFVRWEHYFDAVKVEFKSIIDNDVSGDKKLGYDNWLKKVMQINSSLIQNEHIAMVVCENLYDFYNNYRVNVTSLKTIPLIQLELTDKFNLYMPDDIIEIDSATNFLIIGISKKSDFNLILEGLEIIPPESEAS